ncbi:MAG: DUF5360 family protein [Pseudomonadota bacterium]
MSPSLRWLLAITDLLFLLYWSLAALSALNVVQIDPALMYADYDNPRVIAWNWSFFPLDVVFSLVGLYSIRAWRRGAPSWRPLALISLTLTMTAGGMAVSYWALLGEFDPAWFLPNLALLIWPLFFLRGLINPPQSDAAQ